MGTASKTLEKTNDSLFIYFSSKLIRCLVTLHCSGYSKKFYTPKSNNAFLKRKSFNFHLGAILCTSSMRNLQESFFPEFSFN